MVRSCACAERRVCCVVRCARMAGVIVPVFNMSSQSCGDIQSDFMFIDRWVVISSNHRRCWDLVVAHSGKHPNMW